MFYIKVLKDNKHITQVVLRKRFSEGRTLTRSFDIVG
jgi:hypothetical protein